MKRVVLLVMAVLMLVSPLSILTGFSETESSVSYPIDTNETLTYWIRLNPQNVGSNFSDFNDTDFTKFLEEETGIYVDYVSPPIGQEAEAFSLLVATGEMPDIIDYSWAMQGSGYPGGVEAAIKNKVIIPLNDLIDQYAPDLKAILEANPEFDRMIKTDSGMYYTFPVMKLDDYLTTTAGLVIRYDWLEDLGLDIPETMDDWYNVLTAFKEKKGAQYPFTIGPYGTFKVHMSYGILTGAYGVTTSWFLDNEKVVFGPSLPGYKDWLKEMAKWYAEGLIDPNFATNDQAAVDSNILNHVSGATALWLGSGLGKYIPALRDQEPNYTLGPTPYPVLKAGDVPQFSSLLNPYDGAGACITTSCKNPELAVKFLNYGYSEAGRKTYNYGRQGLTWDYNEEGKVVLTDIITNHEKGWPLGQAWSQYARGVYPGPYFSERRFLELYYPYEEQVKGLEYYTATNMREHLLPPISPDPSETDLFGRIMTDIQGYVDEYTLTAIMGIVDVETTFDNYISQLYEMGMDEAIAIQNTALQRYYNR